jgi:hypothetical protein
MEHMREKEGSISLAVYGSSHTRQVSTLQLSEQNYILNNFEMVASFAQTKSCFRELWSISELPGTASACSGDWIIIRFGEKNEFESCISK